MYTNIIESNNLPESYNIYHYYLKFSESVMQANVPGYKTTSQPNVTFEIKFQQ